jgi:hypothetical protein
MLKFLILTLCTVLVNGRLTAGDPPSKPPKPSSGWGAVPSDFFRQPPFDVLLRGDRYRLGRFDADGNFVPNPESTPLASGMFHGAIPYVHANMVSDNRAVYEHRSGRLIPGTLISSPKGVFVPEVGGMVLDLKKDYDPKTADRRVYNLQVWLKPSPVVPQPPPAGEPLGWKLLPFREAYRNTPEKADPWFARVIGEVMELGHLSDEGEFIPDYGLPVFPFVKVKDPDVFRDGSGRTLYFTLPKDGKDKEEVYEFRSGRLLKGTLQKSGNFVPELGSKVIDFKTYDPSTDRRRIYNLPGVLRRVEK